MSPVTFDEDRPYVRSRPQEGSRAGSIIGLMYRLGVAKTRTDANLVMGGVIAVCLVLSATMFVFVQPHTNAAQAAQLQQDVARLNAQQAKSLTH